MHTDSTDALRGHVSALGSTSMVVGPVLQRGHRERTRRLLIATARVVAAPDGKRLAMDSTELRQPSPRLNPPTDHALCSSTEHGR